ncbi:DUF6338 family protein [Bacillus infantis]|uniref:Uncharacterized protein n=1 Tax=Bacillus infantis TaxID=324767 RepID=A0A5D4RL90_9BACI|nr:DUF6338 family protein [Bacillus infantis]TYS51151.1 hypothetical protein FZD51_03675 [Bacillus infantis]
MQFSELTVRLLLIFFPGIISSLIIDNLTIHRGREFKVFLLHSFMLGLSSYFMLFIVVAINNWIVSLRDLTPTWRVNFLDSLIKEDASINITEVLIATVISIFLSILFSAFINHKLLHRLAKMAKVTKKFGQLDVWSYTFDSPDIGWVIIRDLEKDLMYQGWVEAFSDTHEGNELLLRDVNVYTNSTAQELYFMEGVYISCNLNNIIIEFPVIANR